MLPALTNSLFLLLAMGISVLIPRPVQEVRINGFAQGTTYALSYYASTSVVNKAQIDSILHTIDSSMSLYQQGSAICRFNQSGKGMVLGPHFARVVKKAFTIYKDTNGLFDITVAPLVQQWGFGPEKINSFPDSAKIKSIMPYIGMDKIKLSRSYLSKENPNIQLDLNGIAQGYTVDVLAAFLTQRGIKSFVIELGGELRVKGTKPDGSFYRIGVEGPVNSYSPAEKIKHIIQIKSGAITTSGTYQRYRVNGDQQISHLIDPKTGYPLNSEIISVTVYASDAITADGYDNALMAMPIKQALAFVAKHKKLEAYFIYKGKNGEIADTLSKGFRKIIVN